MVNKIRNMRKWFVVGILGIMAVSVCILYQGNTGDRSEFLTGPTLPEAIEQQCRELQQKRIDFLEKVKEEEEKTELDETEEVMEASLVEQISNPRLQMYSWSTPGLVDPPYCSYAEEEKKELSEFEFLPQVDLELEEAAEWGGDIMYRLVLEPDKVQEYGAILTKSSIEAWENFQWIYANPKDYYKEIYTNFHIVEKDYYSFRTDITMPGECWGNWELSSQLDRTFAEGVDRELLAYIYSGNKLPEESIGKLADGTYATNVQIKIDWRYEWSTGLVQVTKMSPYVWSK